jgi:hypothetical protein
MAQQVLQQNSDGIGQAGNVSDAQLLQPLKSVNRHTSVTKLERRFCTENVLPNSHALQPPLTKFSSRNKNVAQGDKLLDSPSKGGANAMAVTYEVVTQVIEVEEVPEKMPESPWHNKNVETIKELLDEVASKIQGAVVFRDIYFQHGDRKYAPDLAIVLQGSPPIEKLGMIYKVPEDGPAPDVIVEVAVSAKALGEALGEKARFYAELGVKDYLVVEAPLNAPVQLWFSKPASGEKPKCVTEATLESLGVTVKVEGQRIRMFDKDGNEILPLREKIALLQRALEEERAKREELERKLRQQS